MTIVLSASNRVAVVCAVVLLLLALVIFYVVYALDIMDCHICSYSAFNITDDIICILNLVFRFIDILIRLGLN